MPSLSIVVPGRLALTLGGLNALTLLAAFVSLLPAVQPSTALRFFYCADWLSCAARLVASLAALSDVEAMYEQYRATAHLLEPDKVPVANMRIKQVERMRQSLLTSTATRLPGHLLQVSWPHQHLRLLLAFGLVNLAGEIASVVHSVAFVHERGARHLAEGRATWARRPCSHPSPPPRRVGAKQVLRCICC